MAKDVTLKHIGYRCKGIATINLWGGGQGKVEMQSWDIDEFNDKNVIGGVNDGQFGCESIESAIVCVDNLYENDYTDLHLSNIFLRKEDLTNTKKGI